MMYYIILDDMRSIGPFKLNQVNRIIKERDDIKTVTKIVKGGDKNNGSEKE